MLAATNLRKSYGSLEAVRGISFEIGRGVLFGLLGPNGAGKSTTIGMLVGMIDPDAGSVSIDSGGSPQDAKVRSRIGLAPQSIALYEELTAAENLSFYGGLYGLSKKRISDRVEWCLEFAGLKDRAGDFVKTYSGGMKRRLNMAAALIHEPEIVLFDEPTVGVDPQSRNFIFDSIEALKSQGVTILYTTHYMEEAERLCDQVAIMDHGEILASDTVEGLIGRYGGDSVLVAELTSIPDSLPAGSIDGNKLTIHTREPLRELASLTDQGLKFTSLRIDKPDLESVFLKLTGRSLRD
jgi:ABC-2 type transport system ATP-binding protein